MAKDEWFRRTRWTDADQAEFFARLERSRSLYHKSQYIRIQAAHLQQVGLIQESLQLLQRLQAEWPHPSQLAAACAQEAQCHLLMGSIDLAIDAYRRSLELERQHGGGSNARIEFAWLIATRELAECYDEALRALSEASLPPLFPIDQYRAAGARALILGATGDPESAKRFARVAIEAASQDDSGLRYHKRLGLVHNPDQRIYDRLSRMAGA